MNDFYFGFIFVFGFVVGVVFSAGVAGVVVWQVTSWWSRRCGLEAQARMDADNRALAWQARATAAEIGIPAEDDDEEFDG